MVLPNQSGTDPGSEERKEMEHRILMAAASLFNSKGFAGATTRELAQSLGLQRASLYHYLESKQDLLYALCVASMETAAGHFTQAVGSAPPESRLRSAIRAHITAMVTEQDMHAVMLTELRSLDPDRRDEVRKLRSAYEGQWRDLLHAEQAAGRLRSDTDVKFLTLTLLNLVNWPIFWYRSSGPIEPDELSDLLTDLFLEGALPQPSASATGPRRPTSRRKPSQE
jgi:TetR/AcrR family transcriptional regulator, cholesterol catabolism regulator